MKPIDIAQKEYDNREDPMYVEDDDDDPKKEEDLQEYFEMLDEEAKNN